MKRLWILGSADPEMERTEALLRECGETVRHATVDGKRVHPGNAYNASLPESLHDRAPWSPPRWPVRPLTMYFVECAPERGLPSAFRKTTVRRLDHHRSGDPGFGRPPAEFLAASSLGQVIAELARVGALPSGWCQTRDNGPSCAGLRSGNWTDSIPRGVRASACGENAGSPPAIVTEDDDGDGPIVALIPHELVLTAASDHCCGAAYRGECPGVDPDQLMRWRAKTRAAFQGRSVEDVLADVERAQVALESSSLVILGSKSELIEPGFDGAEQSEHWYDISIRDMRRDTPIPELPEAAMRMSVGYVSGPLIGPDKRKKFTCSGTPEQVRAFMEQWAPREGLKDIYGDPARGFAGGYLD